MSVSNFPLSRQWPQAAFTSPIPLQFRSHRHPPRAAPAAPGTPNRTLPTTPHHPCLHAYACIAGSPASTPASDDPASSSHSPEPIVRDLQREPPADEAPTRSDISDRDLLMRLAAPSYVAQIADPVAALVDLYFIGRLGALPLAGASVASSAFNSIVYLFGLLSYSSNSVVAKAVASEKKDKLGRAVASVVVLALLLGTVVAAPIIYFSPAIVRLLGATPDTASHAVGYLRARSLGMPTLVTFFALSGVFRGLADLSRPLYASLAGNFANMILDPLLMFAPLAMGCVGAGLATSLASLITVFYLLVYLVRTDVIPRKQWRTLIRVPWSDVKSIFGPLLALSSKRVLENGVLALACALAARIGTAEAAAMEISRQVWWSVGILWWPIGIACAAIVSKAIAEKSGPTRIRKIANMCLKIIVVLGAIGGLSTFIFAGRIPRVFVREPRFIAAATASLRMMAPLLAVSSVMDGLDSVLIASGDGAINTLLTAIGAAVCVARLFLGPLTTVTHIWEGLLISYIIRAILNVGRFLFLYGRGRGLETRKAV